MDLLEKRGEKFLGLSELGLGLRVVEVVVNPTDVGLEDVHVLATGTTPPVDGSFD